MNPADVEVFAMNAINLDDPEIELAKKSAGTRRETKGRYSKKI